MQFFLNLFIFTDALPVSGGSCAHHQEHTIVHTASGSQPILLLAATAASSSIGWLPEAVCTIVCSWWWAQEPPETCKASVKINKFKKNCILLAVICNYITYCNRKTYSGNAHYWSSAWQLLCKGYFRPRLNLWQLMKTLQYFRHDELTWLASSCRAPHTAIINK